MASHLDDAQEEMNMDMTPMIDVVFLLIIFFLCIEFKTLEAKLPAYLPKDRGSQETEAEPIEQLSIKIVCDKRGTEIVRNRKARREGRSLDEKGKPLAYKLEGHKVHWMVGPSRFDSLTKLKAELNKIAKDPARRVPDKDNPGQTKIMPVVVEPGQQATYGDVAETVDLVTEAGFEEINFGGGMGSKKASK